MFSGKVSKTDITQSTGTSETALMSQKAVSDAISVEETRAKDAEENLIGKVTELDSNVSIMVDGAKFNPLSVTPINGYYFYFPTKLPVEASGYQYIVLDVVEGEKYRISGFTANANIPLAMAWEDNVPNTSVRLYYESSVKGVKDIEVTIPSGRNKMAINGHISFQTIVVEKWYDGEKVYIKDIVKRKQYCPLCVSRFDIGSVGTNTYNMSTIAISRRFTNTHDSVLTFGNKYNQSTNKFFDFNAFGIRARNNDKIEKLNNRTDFTEIIPTPTTDSFTPIVIEALNNADGDNTAMWFTGQNHAYGNVGTGVSATMKELSCNVFVDGKSVAIGDEEIRGNVCKIIVENEVQAYNTIKQNGTGRAVINQKITIVVDATSCKYQVEYTPKEDVKIHTMLGIGQYIASNSGYFRFIGSHSKKGRYIAGQAVVLDTGDRNVDTLRIEKDGYYFDIFLDSKYGVGDCEGNTNRGNALCSTASKIYFNLIGANQFMQLSANDLIAYRGNIDFGTL